MDENVIYKDVTYAAVLRTLFGAGPTGLRETSSFLPSGPVSKACLGLLLPRVWTVGGVVEAASRTAGSITVRTWLSSTTGSVNVLLSSVRFAARASSDNSGCSSLFRFPKTATSPSGDTD